MEMKKRRFSTQIVRRDGMGKISIGIHILILDQNGLRINLKTR